MVSAEFADQAPVPPPAYHRALAGALQLDALTLVTRLHLLPLCALAVRLAAAVSATPACGAWRRAPRLLRGVAAAARAVAHALAPVLSRDA